LLTIEEYRKLLEQVQEEPFRTMVLTDVPGNSLQGLLALKWSDLDWENLTLLVSRAVVGGHVDEVLQDACTARSCAGRVVVELEAKI